MHRLFSFFLSYDSSCDTCSWHNVCDQYVDISRSSFSSFQSVPKPWADMALSLLHRCCSFGHLRRQKSMCMLSTCLGLEMNHRLSVLLRSSSEMLHLLCSVVNQLLFNLFKFPQSLLIIIYPFPLRHQQFILWASSRLLCSLRAWSSLWFLRLVCSWIQQSVVPGSFGRDSSRFPGTRERPVVGRFGVRRWYIKLAFIIGCWGNPATIPQASANWWSEPDFH